MDVMTHLTNNTNLEKEKVIVKFNRGAIANQFLKHQSFVKKHNYQKVLVTKVSLY